MSNNPKTNYLLYFSRIFTGVLFILSGLIKANDPIGFGYKLIEYFDVFHTSFLNDYATPLAIAICGLEIILGALLLVGIAGQLVAWGLLLLIIFFSFLTFYSAYFEVVKTCGCFGDAIKLTPWQSFGKDIILLVFILIIFIFRHQIRPVFKNEAAQVWVTLLVITGSIGAGIYSVNFLPVMDFLPYKIGNNIPKQMVMPKGAQPDVYEQTYTLKNKSTGEEKTMSDKLYLSQKIWQDPNWEVVGEPVSTLIKKGYEIPITDLIITDAEGVDHTQEILNNPYYNFIIVVKTLGDANLDALAKINQTMISITKEYNVRVILLTASSQKDIDYVNDKLKLLPEIFFADIIPLKSMIRANPGVLLVKNGTIINKWNYRNFPDAKTLEENYLSKDQ